MPLPEHTVLSRIGEPCPELGHQDRIESVVVAHWDGFVARACTRGSGGWQARESPVCGPLREVFGGFVRSSMRPGGRPTLQETVIRQEIRACSCTCERPKSGQWPLARASAAAVNA